MSDKDKVDVIDKMQETIDDLEAMIESLVEGQIALVATCQILKELAIDTKTITEDQFEEEVERVLRDLEFELGMEGEDSEDQDISVGPRGDIISSRTHH